MRKRTKALLLSLLYCGLGQIYNNQIAKGVDFIIIYTILITSFFFPSPLPRAICLSILPLMWIIGMVDAYLNREATIHKRYWLLFILPGIIISALIFYMQPIRNESGESNDEKIQANPLKIFSVQVAAFKDFDKAEILCNELKFKGHQVRVDRSLSGATEWFRVLVGKFPTAKDIAPYANKIREEEGFPDAMIVITPK